MRARMCNGHWPRHRMFTAALTVLFSSIPACHKPEPPPVAYSGLTLASSELGVENPPPEPTGFVLLADEPSRGRFPGAMAVARLEPPQGFLVPDEFGGATQQDWWVRTIRWEEAIGWNRLCNTVPAIREIIVLDRFTTVSPNADLTEIAASARRLEASLCLVYGPSPADTEHAGLWGTILDTSTGRKLAFVQAQVGPADCEPPHADRHKKDLRHRDPNYLVERTFQREVRACLLALIHKDSPPSSTQPSPWKQEKSPVTPVYIMPEPLPHYGESLPRH